LKLVVTVLARDEADIIDAQISFHLNAGADFVIATDNNSRDGTTEILEAYERDGSVHLIREPTEGLRQGEWVTRMARLAATEFDADWVINADADEFWWPRGGSLKEVLAHVPPRFSVINAFWRCFVPRPDDDAFFADRMTVRLTQQAPINNPSSVYRPVTKVLHRADPDVVVGRGNHGLVGSHLRPLTTWHPVEVLHFPLRSRAQWMHKVKLQGDAFTRHIERAGTGYHLSAYDALQSGRIDDQHRSLLLDNGAVDKGVEKGTLVVDTRLRDALQDLRLVKGVDTGREFALPSERGQELDFSQPTAAEDAAYAVEAAVLGEADAVRVQRRLDSLEQRLLALEW
jgi:hypothetical protein